MYTGCPPALQIDFQVANPRAVLDSVLALEKNETDKSSFSSSKSGGQLLSAKRSYAEADVPAKPSFTEYLHWAALRREFEDNDTTTVTSNGVAQLFQKRKQDENKMIYDVEPTYVEDDLVGLTERQKELATARRVLRQASWATVFYLITCDILGPFDATYALIAVGMVPRLTLYILFGAIAALTGGMICRLFLRLDSAYGGAMIFPEIMAEMRRPRDFIKGIAMAQIFIFTAYLLYGVFVYSFQGQFTLAAAYQGVSRYAWQTVGNVLALLCGIIAAELYVNIGLKTFYTTVVEKTLNGPPLMSLAGRWIWFFLVIVYWSIAFVLGSAIPSVGTLSGLVAAICIFSRWKRGIFGGGRKRVFLQFANLVFFLTALATAGLGMWATGTALREALATGAATSFGCTPPV